MSWRQSVTVLDNYFLSYFKNQFTSEKEQVICSEMVTFSHQYSKLKIQST